MVVGKESAPPFGAKLDKIVKISGFYADESSEAAMKRNLGVR